MHVNQSLLGQAVFKVVAFCLDASVKMSSPLLHCRVNHSLVKFVPCRHNALTQKVKVAQWKPFMSKLCVVISQRQTVIFCTEITCTSRAIPMSGKVSANYESLCRSCCCRVVVAKWCDIVVVVLHTHALLYFSTSLIWIIDKKNL